MISTYEFCYSGKDGFGSIQFCAGSESEVYTLFDRWCDENSYRNDYSCFGTVYNREDACLYGPEYNHAMTEA